MSKTNVNIASFCVVHGTNHFFRRLQAPNNIAACSVIEV